MIVSDGSLSKDGRHIDITSKDPKFLKELVERARLPNKVAEKTGGFGKKGHRVQISNKNFYDFLLSVGLTPNKSLTIKGLKIQERYFVDFLRGLIDGDGYMRVWTHPSNKKEQWSLRICSGSRLFIDWIKDRIEFLLCAKGKVYKKVDTVFVLKYGKMAAREILNRCYYDGSFGLQRKVLLAQSCAASYRGWSKSKTVF